MIQWTKGSKDIVTLTMDDPDAGANTMNERYLAAMATTLERITAGSSLAQPAAADVQHFRAGPVDPAEAQTRLGRPEIGEPTSQGRGDGRAVAQRYVVQGAQLGAYGGDLDVQPRVHG